VKTDYGGDEKKEGENKGKEEVSSSCLGSERDMSWMSGNRVSTPGSGSVFFSSPQHSDRHWGLPSILSNGEWKINWRGREADHTPPSGAEDSNAWSYTSILPMPMVFNFAQGHV
jgi:hypothetical protein